jgi:hypothetical protein
MGLPQIEQSRESRIVPFFRATAEGSAMRDAVEEFGDEGLVLDATPLSPRLEGVKVAPVDPDVEHGVLPSGSDHPGDLVKSLLAHRDILSPGERLIDLSLILCELESPQFHDGAPRLCNFVCFRLGYKVFRKVPVASLTQGTA